MRISVQLFELGPGHFLGYNNELLFVQLKIHKLTCQNEKTFLKTVFFCLEVRSSDNIV